MSVHLWMTFPSEEEAFLVARYISGNPDVEAMPADGWLTDPETGTATYYNIAMMGQMRWTSADPEVPGDIITCTKPDGTEVEAYCVIGLWHGEPGSVPFPLQAFMVETLPVHYG